MYNAPIRWKLFTFD